MHEMTSSVRSLLWRTFEGLELFCNSSVETEIPDQLSILISIAQRQVLYYIHTHIHTMAALAKEKVIFCLLPRASQIFNIRTLEI